MEVKSTTVVGPCISTIIKTPILCSCSTSTAPLRHSKGVRMNRESTFRHIVLESSHFHAYMKHRDFHLIYSVPITELSYFKQKPHQS